MGLVQRVGHAGDQGRGAVLVIRVRQRRVLQVAVAAQFLGVAGAHGARQLQEGQQRLAVHQFHRHVGQAAVFAEGVDLDYAGMVAARYGGGLAQEAALALRRGLLGQHHLQGGVALQRLVVGAVDRAHAAAAQLAGYLVAAYFVAVLEHPH